MGRLIKPDFCNNIVNISATLKAYFGCPDGKPVLPDLARALGGGYKNVVLLVLDGLGMYPLERHPAEGGFLLGNIRRVLTSVFPSTTTNATTSIQTGAYPMEHGWFGWSLYFEELRRAVDIFVGVDSQTGEPVEAGYVRRRLPALPFYRQMNTDYTANVVVPSFWREEENRYVWTTPEEMFSAIGTVCRKDGKQFVYAYCTQPDSVMHRYGVSSEEAGAVIGTLSRGVEALCSSLKDTLLIVTADHGQIDISGCFELYRDEELLRLLEWPPYLEARASAFKVKEDCTKAFADLFREKYGKDFALMRTEELIGENYFGGETVTDRARLLGDYIAVGTSDKTMKLTPRSHDFKGHHTSLTEEMLVPLIFFG